MDDLQVSENQRRRVLLYVEDQPLNVMLMQAVMLQRPDYELVVAIDGASAMDLAQRIEPDLLMLDINLPDCLGNELLARLRRDRQWHSIPAVAVTSDLSFDIAGSSFCERWVKPMSPALTLQHLDRMLSAAQRCVPMAAGAAA